MSYFQFFPYDQVHNNWLMFTEQKDAPFLAVKPRYRDCVCSKCKKIDHDKAFDKGFEESIKIRAKGDIFGSSEGFLCFNQKAKALVEDNGFGGIVFASIPGTPWHAVSLRCRVQADKTAYTYSKQSCELCGRPKEVTGLIQFLSQIEVPQAGRTFFGPTFNRGGSMNGDRDFFASGDIVSKFKEQGIKGGMFQRLLTAEEEAEFKESISKRIQFKWPKGAKVVL